MHTYITKIYTHTYTHPWNMAGKAAMSICMAMGRTTTVPTSYMRTCIHTYTHTYEDVYIPTYKHHKPTHTQTHTHVEYGRRGGNQYQHGHGWHSHVSRLQKVQGLNCISAKSSLLSWDAPADEQKTIGSYESRVFIGVLIFPTSAVMPLAVHLCVSFAIKIFRVVKMNLWSNPLYLWSTEPRICGHVWSGRGAARRRVWPSEILQTRVHGLIMYEML